MGVGFEMGTNGGAGGGHLHRGAAVAVGDHTVLVGAGTDIRVEDLRDVDVVVSLATSVHQKVEDATRLGWPGVCVYAPMRDYDCWDAPVLRAWAERALGWVRAGHRVLVCCMGGHGRTGTLAAAMIALAEPDCADPIATVRARGCGRLVECAKQAEAVFAVAGRPCPDGYRSMTKWDRGGGKPAASLSFDFARKDYGGAKLAWWEQQNGGGKPAAVRAGEPAGFLVPQAAAPEAYEVACPECRWVFDPAQWRVESDEGERARCPHCGIQVEVVEAADEAAEAPAAPTSHEAALDTLTGNGRKPHINVYRHSTGKDLLHYVRKIAAQIGWGADEVREAEKVLLTGKGEDRRAWLEQHFHVHRH